MLASTKISQRIASVYSFKIYDIVYSHSPYFVAFVASSIPYDFDAILH